MFRPYERLKRSQESTGTARSAETHPVLVPKRTAARGAQERLEGAGKEACRAPRLSRRPLKKRVHPDTQLSYPSSPLPLGGKTERRGRRTPVSASDGQRGERFRASRQRISEGRSNVYRGCRGSPPSEDLREGGAGRQSHALNVLENQSHARLAPRQPGAGEPSRSHAGEARHGIHIPGISTLIAPQRARIVPRIALFPQLSREGPGRAGHTRHIRENGALVRLKRFHMSFRPENCDGA